MIEKPPLPIWVAARAVAKCAANTAVLTAQRRLHLSNDHVGEMVHFADGTTPWVYRETVVDRPPTADPGSAGSWLSATCGARTRPCPPLVSVPGTIHYRFVPGLHRDELINEPRLGAQLGMQDWSRPTQVLSKVG